MFFLLLALQALFLDALAAKCTAPGSPTYQVIFRSTWAGQPADLKPSGAHWFPLVVASHNENYSMWKPGTLASTGVKNVAEQGNNTVLSSELNTAKTDGTVFATTIADSNLNPGADVTLEIQVSASHSLVSVITMMAPSPDWFVGIHDVDLCDGSTWRTTDYVRENFPYDAGTDNGTEFISPNSPSSPPENIFLITSETTGIFFGKNFSSFATTTVKWKATPPTSSPASTSPVVPDTLAPTTPASTQTYDVVFESMWSAANHSGLFPSGAHWSPIVIASHSASYYMWRTGALASTGVKEVAELGSATTLRAELVAQQQKGTVLDIAIASGRISAGAGFSLKIKVDVDHPYVSAVTMMAPSPDWFVGIRDVNLYAGDKWRTAEYSRDNFPYDAGTDSGFDFTSANDPTNPPVNIFLITKTTGDDVFFNKTFPKFGVTKIRAGEGSAASLGFGPMTTALLVVLSLILL